MVSPSNFPCTMYSFLYKSIHLPSVSHRCILIALLLAPPSTEDIKLSASLVTRARRAALVLPLLRGEMWGAPQAPLS